MVHILEAYLLPFTGHVGCQSVTKKQVAGRKGRTSSAEQRDAAPCSELGLLCRGEGQNGTTLCTVLSQAGTREQETPLLAGKEAKPDNIGYSHFSFDIISSSHSHAHTCG